MRCSCVLQLILGFCLPCLKVRGYFFGSQTRLTWNKHIVHFIRKFYKLSERRDTNIDICQIQSCHHIRNFHSLSNSNNNNWTCRCSLLRPCAGRASISRKGEFWVLVRTMALAISCRDRFWASPRDICGGHSSTETGFFCQYISQLLHTHCHVKTALVRISLGASKHRNLSRVSVESMDGNVLSCFC